MAIPTNEEFLQSSARWRGTHHGIAYELSWHGRSEYSPQGTWCWYIFVTSEQFYPDDWAKLRLERQDRQLGESWHRHWAYENFPDVEPHGGWTFGEMNTFLARDGKEHEQVKVGCDYAHSWDRDGDYWQGKDAVERDVKRSIELLCERFPNRREKCAYSGRYDDSDKFYTAISGARVHVDREHEFTAGHWPTWRRKTVADCVEDIRADLREIASKGESNV
jgi:hypothetical protein